MKTKIKQIFVGMGIGFLIVYLVAFIYAIIPGLPGHPILSLEDFLSKGLFFIGIAFAVLGGFIAFISENTR